MQPQTDRNQRKRVFGLRKPEISSWAALAAEAQRGERQAGRQGHGAVPGPWSERKQGRASCRLTTAGESWVPRLLLSMVPTAVWGTLGSGCQKKYRTGV